MSSFHDPVAFRLHPLLVKLDAMKGECGGLGAFADIAAVMVAYLPRGAELPKLTMRSMKYLDDNAVPQAKIRFLDHLRKKLKVPRPKVPQMKVQVSRPKVQVSR